MRATRRLVLIVLAMGVAVLLASGVAWAATFRGNANPNTIEGTDQADTIYGEGGGDTLYGRGGIDKVYGGPGKDKIEGNADADTIYGGEDPDEIDGGDGTDYVEGDEGGDTIDGGADADRLHGDRGADTIKGGAGADTIYGGADGDTIKAGPLDEADVDALYGEDGNDTLDAANYPSLVADNLGCARGDEDNAIADLLDAVVDNCENVLRVEEKSSDRVKGYFDKKGNPTHVEFDSCVDNEEGGFLPETDPNSHPYDRGTSSVITLDDDTLPGDEPRIRIKLTIDPEEKVIRQRATTPDGSQKKLSDEDRKALNKAGDLLQTFFDRKVRGDCNIKNQEALILRHFTHLSETTDNRELRDLDKKYKDPEPNCNSNNGGSSTSLSAKGQLGKSGPASVYLEQAPNADDEACTAVATSERTGLVKSSPLVNPANPGTRFVPLQTGGNEIGTSQLLPCEGTTNFVTYALADDTPISYETTAGPEAPNPDFGRCGTGNLQLAYTQDCLNHDACVLDTGGDILPNDENCGDEFDYAIDDTVLGVLSVPCDNGVIAFDKRTRYSSSSGYPKARDPDSPTVGGGSVVESVKV